MPDPQIVLTIAALNRVVEQSVKQVTRDVTLHLFARTPLDTGWARSNWIPKIGSPFEDAPGSRVEIGPAVAAQKKGLAQVAVKYKLRNGSVYISNNVPYIQPLNDGHSKQAPAGFVQDAILLAVRG